MKNIKRGFTLAELLIVVAIIAVFAAAVNSGTLEIPDINSTVWVGVHRNTILYGKGTQDNKEYSSQMARIDGVALNNSNRDEKIKKLLTDSGLTEEALKVHCKNSNNSWGWYVVCIRGDGTIYVRSGVETNSNRKINNNTDMIDIINRTTKIQDYFNN